MYNFEEVLNRHELFWDGKLNDALAMVVALKKEVNNVCNWDLLQYNNVEKQADSLINNLDNMAFLGDALPSVFPNIGPDFFSVGFGGQLEFMPTTSHIIPFLTSLNEAEKLTFNFENPYNKIMEQLYELLIFNAKNNFLVQLPDLHSGADCLVGWRGPAELCMDIFDNSEKIKELLPRINHEFKKVFFHYYDKLKGADLPCNSWIGLYSKTPYGVPSCDFSYMISPEQFDEFFLPALIEECKLLPRNIFHIDGPGVLNHLDSIMGLPNLQAVQWVYGAGNGSAKDHIKTYKRCQKAGKLIQINTYAQDLDSLFEELEPEGVQIILCDIFNEEAGEYYLKRIQNWK